MPYTIAISPFGLPIYINEAKEHLRLDLVDTQEDAAIKRLIASAIQAVEDKTHQQLLHARYTLTQDSFGYCVRLPLSPVVNVVSVQYLDMDGTIQTVPPADYVVKAGSPATVTPAFGKVWPIPMPQAASVTVTFDAGYASPIAVQTGTANLTVNGPHAYTVGERVTFSNSGGALPTPLSEDAAYLVASVAGNVHTLTDTSGADIVFTGAGTGSSFIGSVPSPLRTWALLRIATLYESRQETSASKNEVVPFADGLLRPYLVVEY